MPDFDVRAIGVTTKTWTDPATGSAPSRVNARKGAPLRRYVGTVGAQIELRAFMGAVDAPLDSALAGRLFIPFLVDGPTRTFSWSSPAGQSSIQRFTPPAAGHYHLRVRRQNAGIVHVHIDVEAAP